MITDAQWPSHYVREITKGLSTQDLAKRLDVVDLQQAHGSLWTSIERFRRRIRMVNVLTMLPRSATIVLLSVLASDLTSAALDSTVRYAVLVIGFSAAIILIVRSLMKWPTALSTALEVDARLSLKERLSTAVEFSRSPNKFSSLSPSQIADAAAQASAISPSQAYPATPARADILIVLGTALLSAIWFLTPPDSGLHKSIVEFIKPVPGKVNTLDRERSPADSVDTPKHELDRMVPSSSEMTRDSLEQLWQTSNSEAQRLSQRIAGAAQALTDTRVARDAGRRLSGEDYTGAAGALRALAESLPGLNSGERQELVEALRKAATATEDDRILSNQFSEAAEALETSQTSRAAQFIQQLAIGITEAGAILESERVLQRQIDGLRQSLGWEDTTPSRRDEAQSGSQNHHAEDAAGPQRDGAGGSLGTGPTSQVRGKETGNVEDLGTQTHLDLLGNFEVVELPVNPEAPTEGFNTPHFQLGHELDVSLAPSAGKLGTVRAKRDSNNKIPLDIAATVSRYFLPRESR